MENPFKKADLTEEQKSAVREYFSTGNTKYKEGKIFFRYGRMKAQGEIIQSAEDMIQIAKEKKQEKYRLDKKKEIEDSFKTYCEENNVKDSEKYMYKMEIAKIKSRADGRTVQLGVQDFDIQAQKTRRKNSVLVEERENPKFFRETLANYNS